MSNEKGNACIPAELIEKVAEKFGVERCSKCGRIPNFSTLGTERIYSCRSMIEHPNCPHKPKE